MAEILNDYFFPITSIEPIPQASTAFLKQIAIVVKPKAEVPNGITACTSMSQVSALTANTEAQQLFAAGMSKCYVITADDLGLATILNANRNLFFTLGISSDFDGENENTFAEGSVTITSYANLVDAGNDSVTVAGVQFVAGSGAATPGAATFQAATSNSDTATSLAAQINAHPEVSELVEAEADDAVVKISSLVAGTEGNAINLAYTDNGTATVGATVSGANLTGGTETLDVGGFDGIIAMYSSDVETAAAYASQSMTIGFYGSEANKAKNMFYALGKLLSNQLNWTNQQYIPMPFSDGVTELGDANSLFDERISFALTDDKYGSRLGLFAVGGKAIVAPYIVKNLEIDLQSRGLTFVSANQPGYTPKWATLLESDLLDVVQSYINRQWIEKGTLTVSIGDVQFVASSSINISEPKALWRIFGQLNQTL